MNTTQKDYLAIIKLFQDDAELRYELGKLLMQLEVIPCRHGAFKEIDGSIGAFCSNCNTQLSTKGSVW